MDAPLMHILCDTLDRHVGQELTADLAARIGAEVLQQVYPGPVDTSAITPVRIGSYVIGPMRLRDVVAQLKPLHQAHWNETEEHRHGLEFNPDYARGIMTEAHGRYVLFCAIHLDTNSIVGNYGLFLSRSTHTQTLMATEDTLFVAAEHRKGRLGIQMIRYAEEALRKLGVRELNVSVKTMNAVGPMIERLGYQHVANQYTKVLTEDTDVRA